MKFFFFACLTVLSATIACKNQTSNSTPKEFYRAKYSTSTEISFQLTRAASIPHKTYLEDYPPTQEEIAKNHKGNDYNELRRIESQAIKIQFTNLSDSQFAELVNVYGGWSLAKTSVLPPSKLGSTFVYQLTDFLPPIAQAIVGTGLISEYAKKTF